MHRYFALLLGLFSVFSFADINLTSINEGTVLEWEKELFSGETFYEISSHNGVNALKAISNDAASGLRHEQRIDLLETPYLNWNWLITQNLPITDERTRSGDDFAARVYIFIRGESSILDTKAISYVWSSSQEVGATWGNPYARSNVKMIAARGKDDSTNQWYSQKQNVYQDLIDQYGDKGSEEANLSSYRYIDIVALMTDTDNSGASAVSYYGDIIFSAE